MNPTPGTQGYHSAVDAFFHASVNLRFEHINADFLPWLPSKPAHILDAGAGVGQNAAALAELGHTLVAVEPLAAFIERGKQHFTHSKIHWLCDSLPALEQLTSNQAFDFILLDGVWHHLSPTERRDCINRFAGLMRPAARLAITLRKGPAGLGTHVFDTSSRELIALGKENGLMPVFIKENQPSQMPNKEAVSWSRVVLEKHHAEAL